MAGASTSCIPCFCLSRGLKWPFSYPIHLLGPCTQGLLHVWVTCAGAQDPTFRRAPGSV